VRRRSEQAYSAVPIDPGPERLRIFLDARAHLVECKLQHRRVLRQSPTLLVYDDVFGYESVARPTQHHLLTLQRAVVEKCLDELYRSWPKLDSTQREQLVAYPATWAQARLALEPEGPPLRGAAGGVSEGRAQGQLEALPLLLSELAHVELRMQILEAGERGEYRPVPAVLPLLLAQPQWNQSPALVVMARSAAGLPLEGEGRGSSPSPLEGDGRGCPAVRPLVQLGQLQSHPNPLVRARLVELMPAEHDWIGWLAAEPDATVREAIRRSVERRMNPHQLVDSLIGPPRFGAGFRAAKRADPRRAEALGWLLVGWSKKLEHSQDWKALNRVLTSPIGAENRQKLKQKLSASGQLSLAASLLR